MKYFIDTEFLEGKQKEGFPISLFRKKTVNTIDLISIGIVSEDGREYYAISKDFNLKEAWNRYDIKKEWYSIDESNQSTRDVKVYWIRENVLMPIYWELYQKEYPNNAKESYGNYQNFKGWALRIMNKAMYREFKYLINKYGKTNKQIAEEVYKFCKQGENKILYHNDEKKGYDATHPGSKYYYSKYTYQENNPEFYAYYADYDWVAFCWLFGKMMDLPKGFPMYCRDLKQELDRVEEYELKRKRILRPFKELGVLPKQTNEHNALDDAKWNYKLYKFLKTL